MESCEKCRFWRLPGECYRYPVKTFKGAQEWCGEFATIAIPVQQTPSYVGKTQFNPQGKGRR
jgi:hypothetical protein